MISICSEFCKLRGGTFGTQKQTVPLYTQSTTWISHMLRLLKTRPKRPCHWKLQSLFFQTKHVQDAKTDVSLIPFFLQQNNNQFYFSPMRRSYKNASQTSQLDYRLASIPLPDSSKIYSCAPVDRMTQPADTLQRQRAECCLRFEYSIRKKGASAHLLGDVPDIIDRPAAGEDAAGTLSC